MNLEIVKLISKRSMLSLTMTTRMGGRVQSKPSSSCITPICRTAMEDISAMLSGASKRKDHLKWLTLSLLKCLRLKTCRKTKIRLRLRRLSKSSYRHLARFILGRGFPNQPRITFLIHRERGMRPPINENTRI